MTVEEIWPLQNEHRSLVWLQTLSLLCPYKGQLWTKSEEHDLDIYKLLRKLLTAQISGCEREILEPKGGVSGV